MLSLGISSTNSIHN